MYFTIRRNASGYYWWRAVADGNNEILAASELLTSKRACEHAIAIVKTEAAAAPVLLDARQRVGDGLRARTTRRARPRSAERKH